MSSPPVRSRDRAHPIARSSRAACLRRRRAIAPGARRKLHRSPPPSGRDTIAPWTHPCSRLRSNARYGRLAQACARALEDSLAKWRGRVEAEPGDPLAAVVALYLSESHCAQPGEGCALAALGSEAARQGAPVRHALTAGMRPLIDLLVRIVPGRSQAARRQKALATFAGMVGAVTLARDVDDPALAEEILQAVSASIAPPRGR